MRKRRFRRAVGIFLTSLLVLIMAMPATSFAAKQTGAAGKVINVVYDDSRSMYLDGETRWCQAKYAMEVFCAMMGEKDVMNIYCLNRKEVLTIKGSDSSRVEQVHTMNSKYAGTPFGPVEKAGEALKGVGSSYERWLVVITDGEFDGTPITKVQATLDGYNSAGIKTVFLAIGSGAASPQGNPSRGAYTEKAGNSTEILTKVTSIANQIFEHQVLDSKFVTRNGNQTNLDIDIPTEQIVVFAQGENAAVGDMQLNGKTIKPTSSFTVRHSGDVLPQNNQADLNQLQIDTSLHGVVVTFDAGSTPFESGKFQVSVTGATTVEYYYRPGVEVNCELTLNGKKVNTSDKLYAGDYEVKLEFINPLTGQPVESELLSAAKFTLEVTNNNSKQNVAGKTGKISLVEGTVAVEATAELPGNISLFSAKDYVVLPEPIILKLNFAPSAGDYTPDRLGENGAPILLTVTNEATGKTLSNEEWNATEIFTNDLGGMTWKIEKGSEVSTWNLWPCSKDGSITSVQPGKYEFPFSASFELGKQAAYGTADFPLTLGAYAGNALNVKIDPPAEQYDLHKLDKQGGMLVTLKYEDPLSGEWLPLTEEMWNSFTLTPSTTDKPPAKKFLFWTYQEDIEWSLEKGTEVGTWILKPEFYKGSDMKTTAGSIGVKIDAEGTSGAYNYAGTGTQRIEIIGFGLEEIAIRFLPYILISLFILWFVIGHLIKKRISKRGLNPRCVYGHVPPSAKRKISKKFLSVVLPYVPEKATIKCANHSYQCMCPDIEIISEGGRKFKVINKNNLPLNRTKFNGVFFPDMDTLRKQAFFINNFEVTSYDAANHRLGTFNTRMP